jgi:hypothetical protein
MIGSLVVIFPTAHKGGVLVLRHGGQEYSIDSGLVLSGVENPSIAYVAFYSDVEHEVTVVESGYRVTLTYNLYVSAHPQPQDIPNIPSNPVMPNELKLKQALLDLLDDKTFLPEGGTIGFGLLHQYPVSKTKGSLKGVLNCLKGSDAALRRVCASFGLKLKLKVIYRENGGGVLILTDGFMSLDYVDEPFEWLLCRNNKRSKGFIVKSRGLKENGGGKYEHQTDDDDNSQWRYREVWWLTGRTSLTRERTDFVAYGNDPQLSHTYGDVVLIAKVGGHGNRQAI